MRFEVAPFAQLRQRRVEGAAVAFIEETASRTADLRSAGRKCSANDAFAPRTPAEWRDKSPAFSAFRCEKTETDRNSDTNS